MSHLQISFSGAGASDRGRNPDAQSDLRRSAPGDRFAGIRAAGLCALLCVMAAAGLASCKKKPEPPPLQVLQRYQAQADRLCRAVVQCIKEDTARRLADRPQHRDMVLARMSQDVCVKNQYQLVGSLSTAPLGAAAADYEQALYDRYGRCVDAVEAASECASRRQLYFEHPECRALRDARPGA